MKNWEITEGFEIQIDLCQWRIGLYFAVGDWVAVEFLCFTFMFKEK